MKTFQPFLIISALLLVPCLAQNANADHGRYETRTLSGSYFQLDEGQVETVYLDTWRHVKKLFVRAEGIRHDATFEVVVNGDTKGTIYVPGRDPSYTVTVGETTQSIQFRHVSGGRISILGVTSVQSVDAIPAREPGYGGRPVHNLISGFAAQAIDLVERLEPMSNYADYGHYLLPIKKVAARAYALANARGAASARVRTAAQALRAQIDFAATYINDGLERREAFDLAVELLNLREKIVEALE